jgi:hypothetical protein
MTACGCGNLIENALALDVDHLLASASMTPGGD